ncbi:hypothetical protein AAFN75_02090 [Algibacter sp. AS12]|uniref:hypothetical protein n=1 Tax=Algibacter sp. AS12 TaxID=3135773 RepID=UPI00398A541B
MKSKQLIILVLSIWFCAQSCVSTRVEATPHDANVVNLECHEKFNWSYLWGLGSVKRVDLHPDTEGVECPCRSKAIAWVEVKTSLTDFALSLVTLGIVNHRKVKYGCAKPSDGEQDF